MDAKDVKVGMYVEKKNGEPFYSGFPHAQVLKVDSEGAVYYRSGDSQRSIGAVALRPVDPGVIVLAGQKPENWMTGIPTLTPPSPKSIDEAWDNPQPRIVSRPQPATVSNSDGGRTSYYDVPEDATTLNDFILHKNMNFQIGNIFKACYRLNEKTGTDTAYDLRKIIFFAEAELKRLGEN